MVSRRSVPALLSQTFCPAFLSQAETFCPGTERHLSTRRSVPLFCPGTERQSFFNTPEIKVKFRCKFFSTIEGKLRAFPSFNRKVFTSCIMSAQLIHNSCIFILRSENCCQTSINLLLTALAFGLWSWLSFPWLTKAD